MSPKLGRRLAVPEICHFTVRAAEIVLENLGLYYKKYLKINNNKKQTRQTSLDFGHKHLPLREKCDCSDANTADFRRGEK